VPVEVIVSPLTPNVTLQPTANSGVSTTLSFGIVCAAITEIDSENVQIGYNLTNATFSLTQEDSNSSSIWIYNTTLPNAANLTVIFQFVTTDYIVDFANQTEIVTPHNVKVTIYVSNWPFVTLRSQLNILMDVSVESAELPANSLCVKTTQQPDSAGNLASFVISGYDADFYSNFLPYALVDNISTAISISLQEKSSSQNTVSLTAPYFRDVLVIDPNFAVLFVGLNEGLCGGSTLTPPERNIAIIAGASAAGGVVLLAIAFFAFYKIHTLRKTKHETLAPPSDEMM